MMLLALHGKLSCASILVSGVRACIRLSLCCVCESHLYVGCFVLQLESQCVGTSAFVSCAMLGLIS